MKDIIKRWLCNACVYYTIFSLILLVLQEVISEGGDYRLNVASFLLLLPCGLCVSAAGLLRRVKSIPGFARQLLHYLITLLSLFLFVLLPAVKNLSGVTVLILIIVFSALYWFVFLIVRLFSTRIFANR